MLQNNAISLRDEDEKLNSEISEMVRRLESAGASQEEFRSRISSPKGADMTRQDEIKPLRKEPVEVKHPQALWELALLATSDCHMPMVLIKKTGI